MNPNLTEIIYIMDASGSMGRFTRDTINGYNAYIETQKKLSGEAFLTTVCFNSQMDMIHNHINIKDVSPISEEDYCPCGMTALLDAVGTTISQIGKRLADTPEDERPAHVIFIINTDGEENCSRSFNLSQVKEMIQHQQEKYSWKFLFLGVGIDAFEASASIGISRANTAQYAATTDGILCNYVAMSCASKSIRSTGELDSAWASSNHHS